MVWRVLVGQGVQIVVATKACLDCGMPGIVTVCGMAAVTGQLLVSGVFSHGQAGIADPHGLQTGSQAHTMFALAKAFDLQAVAAVAHRLGRMIIPCHLLGRGNSNHARRNGGGTRSPGDHGE